MNFRPDLRYLGFFLLFAIVGCRTDSETPEVTILQPADGAVLAGTTQVVVLVKDDQELAVADITIDNEVVYVNDSLDTIMTFSWDTYQEIEGYHSVIGYGRDKFENEAADTITVFCGKPPYPDSLILEIVLSGEPRVITADASYLYIATADNIQILDLVTNEIVKTIDVRVIDLDITSTREYLYAPNGSNYLYRIDLNSHDVVDSILISDPRQGCLHTLDTIYYQLTVDQLIDSNSLTFINLNNDSVVYTIADSFDLSYDIAFANRQVYIPVYSLSQIFAVTVDPPSSDIEVIDIDARPASILSANSQQQVFVATELDTPGIIIISTGNNSITDTIQGPVVNDGHALDLTPDGNYLFAADEDNSMVWICQVDAGAVIDSIELASPPNCLVITEDAQTLYVTSRTSNRLYVFKKR